MRDRAEASIIDAALQFPQVRMKPARIGNPEHDSGACHGVERGYRGDPMVEPGLVTLAKIVGTLLLAMGVIPFLFLLSPGGDKSEPKDNFDDLV